VRSVEFNRALLATPRSSRAQDTLVKTCLVQMVKGTGQRKSETALAPSRESGEAIVKNTAVQSPNVRRNCPWTEAEHKLFLLGLEEYGRGNWRDIAARYVSTRTPTQVRPFLHLQCTDPKVFPCTCVFTL
jgi:SHAQKYF class myb-like DNA-binding protein